MEYQQRLGATSEIVDGEAVVVDPAGTELITLNRVGSLIWNELAAPKGVADLVAAVAARYDLAPREELERDVVAFVEELVAAGLVVDAAAEG